MKQCPGLGDPNRYSLSADEVSPRVATISPVTLFDVVGASSSIFVGAFHGWNYDNDSDHDAIDYGKQKLFFF